MSSRFESSVLCMHAFLSLLLNSMAGKGLLVQSLGTIEIPLLFISARGQAG